MPRIRTLLDRRITMTAAVAVMSCFAIATVNAQTSPSKNAPKQLKHDDSKPRESLKKDDAKTAKKEAAKSRKSKAARRAKIAPQISHRKGVQIPEPTVKLKPGEVPAIKFDEPNFDFGRIRAGEDVKHTYYFTNTGNGPLEILRVKPSCGCTTAGPHTKIVKPGETGQIPIKLSTKHGGNTVSKTVTVSTNIPGKDSTLRLTIKGSIWKPVDVTPNNASFGRVTQRTAKTEGARKLTLVNNVDGAMKPTNVRSDNPHFKAEIKPIEEGKKYELVVELVPPLNHGNNRAKIQVDTGLKDYPTLDVSAYAYVTAPVDVTPPSLTLLPETRRTNATTRQFYVRSNDGKPFDIKNLKSTSDKLKLSATKMQGTRNNTYQLAVQIPADFTPAPNEVIEFETTHPEVPRLTIPVRSRTIPARKFSQRPTVTRTHVASSKSGAKLKKPDESKSTNKTSGQKSDASKKTPQNKPARMKPVG